MRLNAIYRKQKDPSRENILTYSGQYLNFLYIQDTMKNNNSEIKFYNTNKEPKFFECSKCKKAFATRKWSWWSPSDNDLVCEDKCPYCGSSAYSESNMYDAAIDFIKEKHSSQTRTQGTPYFEHPIAVSEIIKNECPEEYPEDVITSALLHDILEDTETSSNELEYLFGEIIVNRIELVTKFSKSEIEKYFSNIMNSQDDIKVIKISDRIHNLRDLPLTNDKERMKKYLNETKEYILPIIVSIDSIIVQNWSQKAMEKEIENIENIVKHKF